MGLFLIYWVSLLNLWVCLLNLILLLFYGFCFLFFFLDEKHVGSLLPHQGSNPQP